MRLLLDDYCTQYCYMDTFKSIQLENSYFKSPDYLVAKVWLCAMLLHQDQIVLTGPSTYRYTKFYPMVVECEMLLAILKITLVVPLSVSIACFYDTTKCKIFYSLYT